MQGKQYQILAMFESPGHEKKKKRTFHASRLNVFSTLPGLSVGNVLHIKGPYYSLIRYKMN